MTIRHANRVMFPAVCACMWLCSACSPSLYQLPAPAPREEWVSLGDTVTESEEDRTRRFLDAKRVAIATYAALQEKDWSKAVKNMSQETQAFLSDGAGGESPETALAAGTLTLGGQTVTFDPVADIFIADLVDLRDEQPGQNENETPRRKELYAISSGGEARKVLFIFEADAWRLHSPFVKTKTFAGE